MWNEAFPPIFSSSQRREPRNNFVTPQLTKIEISVIFIFPDRNQSKQKLNWTILSILNNKIASTECLRRIHVNLQELQSRGELLNPEHKRKSPLLQTRNA